MDQEKVWNEIGMLWKEFRNRPVEVVVDFLEGKRGKILDLGCGSGRNFVKSDELKWHGVDFSQGMLDKARARCIGEEIDVEIKKSGVDDIPYNDNFFDFALYVAVLHCVESEKARRRSLEELYRVLKSGSEALVSVWSRNQKRIKNRPKEGFVPWTAGEKKFERYTYIYDLDELVELCRSVGFEIVKVWEDRNVNVIVRKGRDAE